MCFRFTANPAAMSNTIILAIALSLVPALQEKTPVVTALNSDANGPSREPAISEDGDIVVFESKASNLVSDDTDGEWDVFAHSRKQHRTWRISGSEAIPARNPTISGDGRWVAYWELRPGEPTPGGVFWRIVLRALDGHESKTIDARGSMYPPRAPSMSRDGRWLVYAAKSATADGVSLAHLFDRESGASEIISIGTKGELPDRDVLEPSISSNGRFVVFCTDSLALATPTSTSAESALEYDDGREHVFVRDRDARTARYASDLALKELGYAGYDHPLITPDGRFVAYNHHDSRKMGCRHVGFVSDLVERRAGRLLKADTENWWQGAVKITWMSSDGRRVIVESCRHDLAPVPENDSGYHLYERNIAEGTWKLLSRTASGAPGNGWSGGGVASADVSVVAFWSEASNLVGGDENGASDVFVVEPATGRIERISVSAAK